MTLPYRLWMLALDHYMLCDGCHTIVSGGFGNLKGGKRTFSCMDCTIKLVADRKAEENLKIAASYDPTKQESYE